MRKISRSSYETFSTCKRQGYWRFLYKGTGFDTSLPSWNLIIGLAVHKGFEILLKTGDVQMALVALTGEWEHKMRRWYEKATNDPKLTFSLIEALTLCQGILLGWERARWSAFNHDFEIISVEFEDETLLASNVLLQSRLDAAIRERATGIVYVWNLKTSGSLSDWNQQWKRDIQTWTECLALEARIGEKVHGCIYEGLFKGRYDSEEGARVSVLNYGYKYNLKGTDLFSPTYQRASKEKPWTRFPVWKETFPFGEGIEAWVKWIPLEVIEKQFIRSEPIPKNDRVVERWLRQVVREETDNERFLEEDVSEEDRLTFFKQTFGKHCQWCAFSDVCDDVVDSIEALVESGKLERREDHHVKVESA